MAVMMGCEAGQLRFLQRAKELGFGEFDHNKINIIGELKWIVDFKLPPSGRIGSASNDVMQSIMNSRTLMRPEVDTALCKGCGMCVEQSPVSALSMHNTFPVVNADMCIACFCCQEICSERAIILK